MAELHRISFAGFGAIEKDGEVAQPLSSLEGFRWHAAQILPDPAARDYFERALEPRAALFAAPWCDIPHGNPSGVLGVTRDITERRKADKEKAELRESLARSKKMEALGTLAGGVAHDLNNVLSGIVSYPDLLLMDMPKESPLRRPIEVIQESGRKAAAIVQDLLTLARRGVPTADVVNLNEILAEYLLSPEYQRLRTFHPFVDVETRLAPDLLNIKGSPIHLSKTIMNL
ncbi:MAG: hypothetical protein HGA30_05220, partial [Anaerolineales bacterium]|nr:hypothetical protein [Anaerolineales bacterium]